VRTAPPPWQGAPRAGSAPLRPATASPLFIHVRPYAQRALLDGVEIARGQQSVRFEIPPGPHVLQIEHACCVPYVKQITGEEAARVGELRVPLEARPARLRVEGAGNTRVYVDGRLLGTAAESQRAPFLVPLPASGENPYESAARIALETVAGGPMREVPVRLRAGAEVTVAAPEPEVPP
jgi:serine/threonine-protein kinase